MITEAPKQKLEPWMIEWMLKDLERIWDRRIAIAQMRGKWEYALHLTLQKPIAMHELRQKYGII